MKVFCKGASLFAEKKLDITQDPLQLPALQKDSLVSSRHKQIFVYTYNNWAFLFS